MLMTVLTSNFLYSGFFLTKIFHPNIATNGDICVNALKRDWDPTLGLRHVLIVRFIILVTDSLKFMTSNEMLICSTSNADYSMLCYGYLYSWIFAFKTFVC